MQSRKAAIASYNRIIALIALQRRAQETLK